MSALATRRRRLLESPQRASGLRLVALMFAVLWVVELVNALDSWRLDADGIVPRDPSRLWGILTAPLLHASFGHLLANSLPFLFTGAIIGLRGARPLAVVTVIVVLVGGLGTWLIAPAHTDTVGASGVVFGYSAYLLARGAFSRRLLELLTGAVVAVVLGGGLMISLVPRHGVSWQGHLCGALGGILAAWLLAGRPVGAGNSRRRHPG